MYVKNENTATQTLITYIAPINDQHSKYVAAEILFAEDFDMARLPKSVRAHRYMRINCTPRADNAKNEAGIKRLRRILKSLEGHNFKVIMPYGNSVTEEAFFSIAA